ncbi:nucleotidyltransferase domain-containing protein [Bacillus sp. 165]|uniref:nucleotidyltransferase domain-containing protein n=1 Tax=Bacillus sp. 165 TaxID=1529117 RepID=UPI001ADAF4D7|nr:nucleotidyltransferase domain-containing protein [Bacillus sp. 165]MBO9130859.1 nucleotidyltransferase domain-containing protein [Bacillus sp. 165]
MKEKIITELNRIERENHVKILYAAESGSRAWGISSKGSDYDVRFIYIHKPDWYLSIEQKRDVLEYPINNLLDISGWDLRKALQLLMKSNPALLEWLLSPIVYSEQHDIAEQLRNISNEYISLKASIYHYLNMASRNYRHYLQGEPAKIKKYFYVLRPLLACMWLEKQKTVPPVALDELLKLEGVSSEILNEIQYLLTRKKAGEDFGLGISFQKLHQFIEEKLHYYQEYVKDLRDIRELKAEALNVLFRNTLRKVW